MDWIYDRLKGFVPQLKKRGGIAIFPYGVMGHRVQEVLQEAWDIKPSYLVDNASEEKDVIALDEFMAQYRQGKYILIFAVTDFVLFRELLPDLFCMGLHARDLIILRKEYLLSNEALEWLLNHQERYHTVLDVGCGAGLQARIMADYGFQVTGLTMSSAKGYTGECLQPEQVVRKDFFAYNGDPFDVVYASHILEHIPAPEDFLKRARQMVKPGGCLIITVPNDEKNILNSHIHTFNAGRLLRYLLCAGFDCRKAQILTYGYNLSLILPEVEYIEENLYVEEAQTSANLYGNANHMFNYIPAAIDVTLTWNHVRIFCGDIRELNWEHGIKVEL